MTIYRLVATSAVAIALLAPEGARAAGECVAWVGNPPFCVRDEVGKPQSQKNYEVEKKREREGDGPALVPIPSTGPSPFGPPKPAPSSPSSSSASPRPPTPPHLPPPPHAPPHSPTAAAGSYCYIPGKRIFHVPGPPAACRAYGAVPAPDFIKGAAAGNDRPRPDAYGPGHRPDYHHPDHHRSPSYYYGSGYPGPRPYGSVYSGPRYGDPGYSGMGYSGGYR